MINPNNEIEKHQTRGSTVLSRLKERQKRH
jgi:hypothetical protein